MNVTALVGRLVRDPELRYLPNGTATCTFTIAVDDPFKKDDTDFIPIVVWRQQAEHCANFTRKGRLVGVSGKIKTRNYEKDGRKIYVTEVVADNVRFLDKSEGGQDLHRQEQQVQRDPFAGDGTPINISSDDLPF